MDYTRLGRTDLRVSRMGLGCGGHSRLGLARGGSDENAERIVREAIAIGVNFIDTAENYGTESVVGRAVAGRRGEVVISTKLSVNVDKHHCPAGDFPARVEGTLQRLQTDYVDILHLHGVSAADYPYARDEIHPVLQKLKHQGKIRHLGITEAFSPDPGHAMLGPAVANDPALWDVVMVGFNLLNPSARDRVLPHTQKHDIGTLCMFAVRRALSQPDALRDLVAKLVAEGTVAGDQLNADAPLDFLAVAGSVTEAAYRFCLHEPGLNVILSGTGNAEHLRENAQHLSGPPLPGDVLERLSRVFGKVDSVSGN